MPSVRIQTVVDSGTYYVANNAASGVATAATPTAYSDTAPFLVIQNKQTLAQSGPSIYMDWIRFYETAAGTAGVGMLIKMQLDMTVATGGTLLTPVSTSSWGGSGSVCAPRILPTGIAATSNARVIIGNKNVIPTQTTPLAVNTEVTLNFGGTLDGDFQSFQANGTAVTALFSTNVYAMPPVVIGPGWSLSLQHLITSQSAASSWGFELGWAEA